MASIEITTLGVGAAAVGDKRLTIDQAGELVLTDQPFEHQITDVEINEDSVTPSLVKGSQLLANDTFDGLSSAVAFVTSYPNKLVSLTTSSEKTVAECATAGIQYPDGKGASYAIIGAGTETADGINFIDAGTKQLKLDREKGGQRLISLVDKKTSLRMATTANIKYNQTALKKRSSVSLFLRGTSSSAVETNQRLINDPRDHFDVEIPILSEPTVSTLTLISQNLSATGSSREFQIYYNKSGNEFVAFVGGASYAMPVTAPLKGSVFRFRLSGRLNVLSASRDGVVFYTTTSGFSGANSEPTATTTISARNNGSAVLYSGGSDTVIADVNIRTKPRKIVVLGASIMNGAFNNPVESVSYNHSIGSNLGDLAEYAVSGDTISDTVAALPAILAAETEPCLFIMHIGGNDVSETRPYNTAAINRLDNLENGLIEVINTAKAAGHDFALANLTYRNYSDIRLDGSNGSLPYNYNIVEPLIRELTPEWWNFETDRPILDLYQWAFDNQNLMQGDGIHYTESGYDALREHILCVLADNYPKVSGYFIPLDSGSMIEPFYSYDGTEYNANLINFNPWDWFAGSASGEPILNFASSEIEGVGGQLMLKNISGGVLAYGHYATDSELRQVFWDSAGVLTESVDALPVGSIWRSVNGGTVPVNATKMFVRVS